jgi:hypothetical protein
VSLRRHLDLLRHAHGRLADRGPEEEAVASILSAAVRSLPLRGAVVRDEGGAVLAAAGETRGKAAPVEELRPDFLLSSLGAVPRRGLPLPEGGGRLELRTGWGRTGWLDLWGNGAPADMESRRSLTDVGQVLGLLLDRRERAKSAARRG